ncbi:hypothetical protein PDJAM_G00041850 [Pangasius djambal]|uniref:Uncharacterized protein n=1 Tax=Pangasius djambal TaxID=1691987 RepID=A0ACC5YT42_9TELE|nr:hypothetical protein [Pangasius djambal]
MAPTGFLSFAVVVLTTIIGFYSEFVDCNNGRRGSDGVESDLAGFSVPLEHSFEVDDVPRFRTRGTIQLKAGRENSAALSQMELSEKDRTLLKAQCSSWPPVQRRPQQGAPESRADSHDQWMYIVPLVLFLMMSGAQDQSGGGASGGAASGGGR